MHSSVVDSHECTDDSNIIHGDGCRILLLIDVHENSRSKKKKASLHGESWAFGQSATREDALWKNGVEGETLSATLPEVPEAPADPDAPQG